MGRAFPALSSTLAIYRRSQRRTDWVAERIGVAWRVSSRRSRHVACACPLRHDPCSICPGVCAGADLAARADAGAGRAAGAGAAHGVQHPAHHRAAPGAAFRELAPGAEPRRLGQPVGGAFAAEVAGGSVCPNRPGAVGRGRQHRARPRQADQRQGHLSRSGAVLTLFLRQDQRPALAEPDAAQPDALGRTGLGPALPDRAGPVRTLLPGAWAAAQDADRLGATGRLASPPLAARARDRAARRQQLRGSGPADGADPPWRHRRDPAASGRRAIRTCTATPARHQRAAAQEGQAPAKPGPGADGCQHTLAVDHRQQLVWHATTLPGDLLADRGVVPQRPLPIRWVLLRDPQGQFEPQALLCTDPMKDPLCVIGWFVQRWSVEVTFREGRDHLGFESQRQWTDKAIARTTPCLLGRFSLVALFASQFAPRSRYAVWTAAWYRKQQPTFADTLAAVRREIWKAQGFSISRKIPDMQKLPRRLQDGITHALCYAA